MKEIFRGVCKLRMLTKENSDNDKKGQTYNLQI